MFGPRHFLFGVLVCLFVMTEAIPSKRVCKHWCKTPQEQFYCCNDNPFEHVNSGHCPLSLDTFCGHKVSAQGGGGYEPPKRCSTDGGCRLTEKCCHDKCLKMKVCKPAIP